MKHKNRNKKLKELRLMLRMPRENLNSNKDLWSKKPRREKLPLSRLLKQKRKDKMTKLTN